MLRLYNEQPDLWEATLPAELRGLPAELAAMDEILKDETFLAPFEEALKQKVDEDVFSWFEGRPSTFMSSYVRLMVLKFRRRLSYEDLLMSVNESVFLRRFCGYSISDRLPHDTTLIKLTGRLGEDFVKKLNEAVVEEAQERKITRGRRMRIDTTATGAHIGYPTDTGLLGDGIRVVGRLIKKIKKAGKARTVSYRSQWRAAKKILRKLGQNLKNRGRAAAKSSARKAKEKLVGMAKFVHSQARRVHGKIKGAKDKLTQGLAQSLAHYLALLQQIIEQSEKVLAGQTHLPDRLVSLFDPDARPIQRGKLFPKTEFGYKTLFQESEGGILTNYGVFIGNPSDTGLLEDAVKAHRDCFGHYPDELATDRGFKDQETQERLSKKIDHISIPARGYNKDPVQQSRQKTQWFWRLQRWRAGAEAAGSLLKRCYGWGRSHVRGLKRTTAWIGYGALAFNLWRIARAMNSS
jgi:IS5 family transposase